MASIAVTGCGGRVPSLECLGAQLHLGRRVSRDSACRSSDHLAIGPPERRHGVEDLAPQPHLDSPEIDGLRVRAAQGDADAQYHLGVIYVGAQGVPQDDVQAHMWYNLAAPRFTGPLRESTVRRRDIVAGRMTAEQVAEAQRLAREWDAAHPRDP